MNPNNTAKWILLGIACIGMPATSIYTFASTNGQVRTNTATITEVKVSHKALAETLHEIDKRLERVVTILEEREQRRSSPTGVKR